MKILKSAVVALSLAAAMGSFSTTAIAGDDGRKTYKPGDLITTVAEKIDGVVAAINNGSEDTEQLGALIKNASNLAEEINANDKVARENSKATKHFKAAIASTKSGDLQATKDHLGKAKEVIVGLRKLL